MGVKVSAAFLNYLPSIEGEFKKVNTKRVKLESSLYTIFLRMTRDINELSSIILELDDFNIDLNLKDFEGQL